jgi:hypothetical protein
MHNINPTLIQHFTRDGVFCFGIFKIIGGPVPLSRSGITIWRTARRQKC